MNRKLLNTQIEALTRSHGAEIVSFYKENGFDVSKPCGGCYSGILCKIDGDDNRYYGVDSEGLFTYRYKDSGFKTITLEQAKELVKVSLEELIAQRNELNKLIEQEEKGDWKSRLVQPSEGFYYYIQSSATPGFEVSNGFGEYGRKPEHAFKTEEQAELTKEKILLMQEMLAFAHVRNEGWQPNWGSEYSKYGIVVQNNKIFCANRVISNEFAFGIAVKSKEIAEEMKDIFGDRLMLYYNKQY